MSEEELEQWLMKLAEQDDLYYSKEPEETHYANKASAD